MNKTKRLLSVVMATLLFLIAVDSTPASAQAASKYITVKEFAKELAQECNLKPIDYPLIDGYIDALMLAGIIKDGDFKKYDSALTRGDAMVLLNRADEYLYGDKLDPDLVQLAIDKRISDIKKVKEAKRADVAKAYLKGFMKGGSNGNYCTDRNMKVNNKITKTGALNCIKLIKNKKLRAKISPDGQLIRTTNLPKYAKYFPYILASFPNSYYDWKFQYEIYQRYGTREDNTYGVIPYVNGKDYYSPADLAKEPTRFDADVTDECFDVWTERVRTYMEHVFNVDYRTIGEQWVQEMFEVSNKKGDIDVNEELRKKELRDYIAQMKENKTIVESSTIAVDRSSIFFYDGSYWARVYVKYRIVSSKVKYKDAFNKKGEMYAEDSKIFNRILYNEWFTLLNKFTIGKWKTYCFHVRLAGNQRTIRAIDYGVAEADLTESPYDIVKIK